MVALATERPNTCFLTFWFLFSGTLRLHSERVAHSVQPGLRGQHLLWDHNHQHHHRYWVQQQIRLLHHRPVQRSLSCSAVSDCWPLCCHLVLTVGIHIVQHETYRFTHDNPLIFLIFYALNEVLTYQPYAPVGTDGKTEMHKILVLLVLMGFLMRVNKVSYPSKHG